MMNAEALTQLAQQSFDMRILAQIARHPNASGDLLQMLWDHPHVQQVREEAINNPHPRDFAGYDASDEDNLFSLEAAIAQHPNVPQVMLEAFARQPRFGGMVAHNPRASAQLLDAMVRQGNHYAATIRDIGEHPNTSSETLEIIVCRVWDNELTLVKTHPNLSPLALEIIAYREGQPTISLQGLTLLAMYGIVSILSRIAHEPETPASVLHHIFNRVQNDPFMLRLIAAHPNTPPEIRTFKSGLR